MHIGVREAVQFEGLTFNSGTLEMTWITMGVLLIAAVLATRNLKQIPTSKAQNIAEMIVEFLHSQIGEMVGERGKGIFSAFVVTLFTFVLVSNWLGLVPGFESPTNDLNTTLGLALLVSFSVHALALYYKGMHHLAHYFQPMAPFVVIHLIEEISKPITLSFRLFGNILAGEVLIVILLQLVKWTVVPHVVWLGFSVFVGAVQAFLFTVLTLVYVGTAVAEEEH